MPLRNSRAIVLRHYRFAEADKIVVFLTREFGKLRGIAKGARRMRSRFGGGLEVGTEIELTFFEKESRDLVSIDRCDIVRSSFATLREPLLVSAVSYFTDLVDSFAPERERNDRLFRLLQAVLGSFSADSDTDCEKTIRYFEAWILRLGGFYPRNKTCPACGQTLAVSGANYDHERSRLGCPQCFKKGSPLSPAAIGYTEHLWKTPPGDIGAPKKTAPLRELGRFHYRLIQQQLEGDVRSHQILQDLLSGDRAETSEALP